MYNKDIYPALQTFGIEHLRDEQERALTPILAGRDVLVRLRAAARSSTGTRAQRRARRPAELRPQHVHAR